MWKKSITLGILLTVVLTFFISLIGVDYLWVIMMLIIVTLGIYGYVISVWMTEPITELTTLIKQIRNNDNTAILGKQHGIIGDLYHTIGELTNENINHIIELEQDLEVLSLIFSQLNDGVIVTNLDGEIGLVNETALDMFHQDEPITSQRFADLVRHHEIIELWQRCVQTQKRQSNVVDISQTNLFLEANISPIQTVELNGYLVILHDLTTTRRLETIRRDFISNISHELRTPLTSLQAIIETLQDGVMEDDPVTGNRFLDRANIEVGTMTQMVAELLELSLIESGRVPIRLAQTDLEYLLDSVKEHLSSQAKRKNLTITIDVSPDTPLVLTDEARIERVVTNLIHNAIKFTPEDGFIRIQARPSKQKSHYVEVQVIDNGIGIPKQDLPRIFERFYKTDRARTSRGTGIGLSIVKHIIQAHGGQIEAQSKEGIGSTFIFTLPTESNDITQNTI